MNNILNKIVFINYDEDVFFKITILLKTKEGIVPYNCEITDFINNYPHLAKQLIDGKIIYIDSDYGYVGIEKSEGPYCERKIFESEYEEKNISFYELIIKLNENIKNKKIIQRKLIKIGDSYIK